MQAYDAFGKVGCESHAVIVLVYAAKDEVSGINVCRVDPSFGTDRLPLSYYVLCLGRDIVALED